MVEVKMEHEFEFGAEKLWAVIADFGNVDWVPGVQNVELEGEGVGMIRHITVPTLPQLHERMDAMDSEKMILDYSIPTVEFIQVKNYFARAQVFAIDGGHCRVVWSCTAEADGAQDAEATAKTQAFYEGIFSWIDAYLHK